MSGLTTTAVLPAAAAAAQAGIARLQVPVVSPVARAALPATGIAVGLYLALALLLIIVGFVLRYLARPASA